MTTSHDKSYEKKKKFALPRMLIHIAEENDTRRKLVAATMEQSNTRILEQQELGGNFTTQYNTRSTKALKDHALIWIIFILLYYAVCYIY